MLLTTGERVSMALVSMALADLGVEAMSFTGSQVGIITDTVARQGQDPRGQGRPGPRRRWPPARCASSPASRASAPTRRSRRSGRGGSDTTAVALAAALQRRQLRDLHRRHRRVHRRPADRAAGPQAAARQLRRDARDGRRRQQGAGAAQRRVRPQPQRPPPRALRFTWEPGTWITDQEPSMEDPIISGVVTDIDRVEGHHRGRARPARHLGGAVRAARRGQRQRRHDRAEHQPRGHDRHQLHDAEGRHGRRRVDRQPRRRTRSVRRASTTMPTSPRSAWSAPA